MRLSPITSLTQEILFIVMLFAYMAVKDIVKLYIIMHVLNFVVPV